MLKVSLLSPFFIALKLRETLENNLMLFYTAIRLDASEKLETQIQNTDEKFETLRQMKNLVPKLRDVISSGLQLHEVGEILYEGWMLKKKSIIHEI